jgi:hypothetical protein
MNKAFVSVGLVFILGGLAAAQSQPAQVTVESRDAKPTTLTLQDLKKMPRQTVAVKNPKTKTKEKYEGVLLSSVLAKAGAPTGKTLHGPELRDYVEVAAADDYRVIFSLSELDPPTHANRVLLADTMDGKALKSPQGPLKLIAPDDLRPERWVRMVTKINIHQAD